MRIVNAGTQHIPNGLVLSHIKSVEAKYVAEQRMRTIPANLRDALRDVKTNLCRPASESTAPTQATIPKMQIARLTKTLTGPKFKLLPSEALHLLNHRIMYREELEGMIEELELRMDEDTQNELLEVVKKTFEEGAVTSESVNGD